MFSVQVKEDVLTEYISESTVNDSIGNIIRLTEKSLSNDNRGRLYQFTLILLKIYTHLLNSPKYLIGLGMEFWFIS